MILQYISYNPVRIKVSTPSIGTKWFLKGQNDGLDAFIVPYLFQPDITKSHHGQILYQFFAQIMINPVDMIFGKMLR